jgi:hypothetical protein
MIVRGVSPVDEVMRIRGKIAEMQAEIKALLARGVIRPHADAAAWVEGFVARAAERQDRRLEDIVVTRASLLNSPGDGFNDILAAAKGANPLTLLCSLFPKQVEARLLEALAERYGGAAGMVSADERDTRVAALKSELFEAELEEERIVYELEKCRVGQHRCDGQTPILGRFSTRQPCEGGLCRT